MHGIPSSKVVLKDGDVVSVDCGTFMKGFYGDSAYTFAVGKIAPEAERLLRVTKEALYKGVAPGTAGHRIGDIGYAVQEHAEKHGYSVVREMSDTAWPQDARGPSGPQLRSARQRPAAQDGAW